MLKCLASFVFTAMMAGAAMAGPFEDGIAAYKTGNYSSAFSLWQPLAERGDPRAENNLGVLYEEGRGVAVDFATAADWYQRAAEKGHEGGRKNLADLIARGLANVTAPPSQLMPDQPAALQPGGLVAGIGDIVLRVETSEALPNVFGKPDIFGRTRPTGVDILQFAGLREERVVFVRTGVSIQSGATTMTESPRYMPLNRFSTFSGNVGNTQIFGSGTSTGGIWVPPRGSSSTAMQLPAIEIEVDWQKDPVIVMNGKRLVIRSVTATTLTYAVDG